MNKGEYKIKYSKLPIRLLKKYFENVTHTGSESVQQCFPNSGAVDLHGPPQSPRDP